MMQRDVPANRPNAPQTGWQVTGQTATTELGPNNAPTQGYRVQFTTGAGQSGSVFLPMAQYSADNVRAAIAAHAATMDQVAKLTG